MIKILIPTDFSENAQNAINYAVNLFWKEICTFYILHAHLIAPPATENKSEEVINLKKIVQELKEHQNPCLHTFKWLLMTDIPISAIKATLTEKKIDYLFLGTKGNSTSSKISIGGTAISIIEFSSVLQPQFFKMK